MAFSRSRSGQSVIEVLIAISLLATMSAAAFALLSSTFSEGLAASERARAENLVANGFEAVRQIRDASFDDLVAGTHGLSEAGGTWIFSGTEDADGKFHRSASVVETNDVTREVTIAVTWENAAGRSETRSSTTVFTNWRDEIIDSSSNCYGSSTSGDWSNPVVVGSADIGAGNQGTDLVVNYPYVFVSGVAASSNKPDLFAYDASNPASPVLIDSIDVGADGINALIISGTTLFAASANDSKEFMVFDVSDPANLQLIGSTNPSGNGDALSISINGDLVVLGRTTGADKELYFYDISTPSIPSLLANFDTAGDVNDITSSRTHYFVATGSATEDILVFDIANPLIPALVATYDLAAPPSSASVAYNDPGILFVGNTASSFTPVDVSDPLVPVEFPSTATGGQIKDIVCTQNQLVFVGTTNSNSEFMILDISDVNAVVQYATLNFPQVVGGLDFAANMVFAAVRSNDALRIITSSP